MKLILTLLICLSSFALFAQRLYLQDIQNGNYKSYDLGDKIEVALLDSTGTTQGMITSLSKDGFTLNDSLFVPLSNIAGIVQHNAKSGSNSIVVKVLLIGVGGYLMLTGGFMTLVGIPYAFNEPGAIILVGLGAGITVGGYAIIKSQVKKRADTLEQKTLDNIQYRMFIE